ncbi:MULTISPECIES: hypothetical protein [Luteibacter]|uniref:hypothetical protein n=1 Tax=Luteibacter TaxID=242605 RepID=UPI0012E04499|nr:MULTISPECIES: hypothetical protein [unclassified Luteibacter]
MKTSKLTAAWLGFFLAHLAGSVITGLNSVSCYAECDQKNWLNNLFSVPLTFLPIERISRVFDPAVVIIAAIITNSMLVSSIVVGAWKLGRKLSKHRAET